MATYMEIRALFNNSELINKTQVACVIAAETIRTEDVGTANHANRLLWAKAAFASPASIASQVLMAILAANSDLTVAQITGATDAVLQGKVDAAVDLFATGV